MFNFRMFALSFRTALAALFLAIPVFLAVPVLDSTATADASVKHRAGKVSNAAVRAYWTPKRMAQAKDMSRIVGNSGSGKAAGVSSVGIGRGPGSVSGLRHGPASYTDPGIGRIFFRWLGGKGSCSGAVINTPSKRLVLTAGHCLKLYGAWSSHIYFVPDYFYGQRPYGSWVGKVSWVTKPWGRFSFEDMSNYDLGVIVTQRSRRGKRVGDVAGSLSYQAFPRRHGVTRIFGYPGGANRGRELRVCGGRRTWTGPGYSRRQPGPVGIAARCNMAAGSSGGPWLSAYRGANGGTEWILDGLKVGS